MEEWCVWGHLEERIWSLLEENFGQKKSQISDKLCQWRDFKDNMVLLKIKFLSWSSHTMYPGKCGKVNKLYSWIFLWHWVRMPWWFRWPARIFCAWNFPGKKYWSGLPFPSPGDLPNPGIKPTSLVSSALAGIFFTTAPLEKPILTCCCCCC